MATPFKDFIPEGEDNSAFSQGGFRDFVPAGEELPEGMTGDPMKIEAKPLKDMSIVELIAEANRLGSDIKRKPGLSKKAVIEIIDALTTEPVAPETDEAGEPASDGTVEGLDETA